MRNVLAIAMVVTLAFCIVAATVAFGAVGPDLAAPAYGLAAVLAILWVVKLLTAEVVTWKWTPMHVAVLAFAVYAIARHLTCPIEYESRLELSLVLLCGFIYFAAAANFYRSRDRSILLYILMALAVLEAIYGIWQFATRAETVLSLPRPPGYYHRGGGTYLCPNHLAGFLEMTLGLALGGIALRKSSAGSVERATLEKVLLVYAAIMMMAGIVTTLSRAGGLATVVGALVVLLWGDWRSRTMWPRLAVAGIALGILVGIVVKVQPARDYISLTFWSGTDSDTVALKDRSVGGRTMLWQSTWRMIRDHPLVGTGPRTWEWFHQQYRQPKMLTHTEYAHNDILNLASDYGLIGFGIVLAAIVCFYRQAILLARAGLSAEQRSFALGAIIAVTMIGVHSWFDFNLHIPANAMLLATIMGSTVAMEDEENRFAREEMNRRSRYALAGVLLLLVGAGAWIYGPTALAARYTTLGIQAKVILERETATNYFHRAISIDPKYPEPYTRLADVYLTQSEWRLNPARAEERQALAQQAVPLYQKSLALNPYQSALYLRLGRAHELAGQDDQALSAYQRAIAVDPNSAGNYLALGLHYRRTALPFSASDFTHPEALVDSLRRQAAPVSQLLWSRFSEPARRVLADTNSTAAQLQATLIGQLNVILRGDPLYDASRFAGVQLSEKARTLIAKGAEGEELGLLNRLLLEDSYPQALSKSRRISDIEKGVEAFKKSFQFDDNSWNDGAWLNAEELRGWL